MTAHYFHSLSLTLSSFIRPTPIRLTFTMADDAGALVGSILFYCILYALPIPPWIDAFFAAFGSLVFIFEFAATLNQCRRSRGNLNPCYTMFKRMGLFLLIMYIMIPICNAAVSLSLFLLMIFHCIRTISNRN